MRQRGFTLIELLVAIVILGILAALVVFILTYPEEVRYERRYIDGVECLYDNWNQRVVSCDWGPR